MSPPCLATVSRVGGACDIRQSPSGAHRRSAGAYGAARWSLSRSRRSEAGGAGRRGRKRCRVDPHRHQAHRGSKAVERAGTADRRTARLPYPGQDEARVSPARSGLQQRGALLHIGHAGSRDNQGSAAEWRAGKGAAVPCPWLQRDGVRSDRYDQRAVQSRAEEGSRLYLLSRSPPRRARLAATTAPDRRAGRRPGAWGKLSPQRPARPSSSAGAVAGSPAILSCVPA